MTIYIAFLRGINVGGKHPLPMKELAAILEELGSQNVKTYIQSGNAVFKSRDKNPARFSKLISAEIKKRRGFEPHVLLLKLEDIEQAITENPFPEAETDPKALHVGFLVASPQNPNLKILESLKSDSERFHLIDNIFYLHAPEGVGRSKLAANAEKLLGVPMTDRNWSTVRKVWEMAKGIT
ncbi:MAG TPA: DUF1697 domain-containing protein [Anaerolineales bacterium]|nr:DUF1697 domain-containing protein [Anaerolineales bacterium]